MISRAFAEVAGRCYIRLVPLCGIAAMMAALFPFTASAQGVGKQMLHEHVPPAIARFHLRPMNRLPATNRLDLAIGLPLRNQEALNKLLSEIYDPASTNYHRYLTPEQFAAQFGPAEQDYQSLINFAKTNGLTVTATYPNRVLLDVSGNAATVEKVFHVTLRVYQHPTENRSFFAPDAEPSIDFTVPVLHVSGLDNFSIPRPAGLKKNPLNNRPAGVVPAAGSGPSGSYMGNDFRAAYAPGVTLNGAGQIVGLLEFDGYYASDITNYEHQAGLPNVLLQNVLLDGFSGSAGGNNLEVAMDIELVISMATNLASVVVFEAGPSGNFDDILNSMVSSNYYSIKQFSSSWGSVGSPDLNADQIFMNMAVQGQSFFQASGDGDAWVNPIWVPAASPYVTTVGGTMLTMNSSGASYSSETVWNSGYDNNQMWAPINGNGYSGSGGGVSSYYSIPSWQQGINMVTNQGSTTMRNIPDVALTADNIFVLSNNGQSKTGVGGTSCAAPLWAGFMALVNQQATALGKPAVGFLNPAIYAIGKSPNYAAAFHDITTGNNFSAGSPTNYPAVPGYDLCTGWGTPNGANLINALVPLDPLGISPASGFVASGPAGGSFSPASQIYFLTNSGASPLTWSLVNTSAWLNASVAGGTLAAGATNSVTVSLTAAANSLAVGTYAATINLTNWNTHVVQSLQFTLQALQPLSVAPTTGFAATGPAAGPFSPNAESFQLTNTGNISLTWSLINTSAWLTASSGGVLAAGATTTATVSLSSAATNLATGTYTANVWFTNQTSGGAQNLQFILQALQPLSIAPTNGFTAAGLVGGPFSPNSESFQLTNTGNISMTWSLINTSAWLTASSGGVLAAGGTTTATISLSSAATNLATGTYVANVWFTNQTRGGAQSLEFNLLVNETLIQNGGFETGDFTGWTLSNDGNSLVDNGSTSKISPHSGTYLAALGAQNSLGYLSQTLQTVASQSYLLSLWFNVPTIRGGNTPNELSVSWNGNTLFDQINIPPTSAWTNLQFIVTATGNSSVLQFGEQDDPWYFGLDDVSLTLIPAAAFQPTTVTATNNNLKFAWNAMTGLVYQVQFKTNLLQTNWVVLKSITATNTPVTFVDTNPIAGFPQKFYRLLLLP